MSHVAIPRVIAPVLVRQSVQVEMNIGPASVNFPEQSLNALLQGLIFTKNGLKGINVNS